MLIAQLTDTHIRPKGHLAYRRIDTTAYLRAAVQHLNNIDPKIDLALFTGDLTDSAAPEEYELFVDIVSELHAPLYVIPGNHDDRIHMREAFPSLKDLCGEERFLHYVIETQNVRFIGLDTLTDGAAHGSMCAERLAWFDAKLSEAPNRPTVVFMHHPPFLTGIGHMDLINCQDAELLGRIVKRHPQIKRILCGHVHRSIFLDWNGIVTSIAPSPAHSVALDLTPDGPSAFVLEPSACQLHDIFDNGNIISHLSYIGEFDGPYPFYAEDGSLIS